MESCLLATLVYKLFGGRCLSGMLFPFLRGRLTKYLNCNILTACVHRVCLKEERAIYGKHVVYFFPLKWDCCSGVWHAWSVVYVKRGEEAFGKLSLHLSPLSHIQVRKLSDGCVLRAHVFPISF